jgi:hypothetical protein
LTTASVSRSWKYHDDLVTTVEVRFGPVVVK